MVLGILLTSGCATSRHCQQQELPGVRIHCCDTDLCNGSPQPPPSLAGGCLLLPSLLAALLLSLAPQGWGVMCGPQGEQERG